MKDSSDMILKLAGAFVVGGIAVGAIFWANRPQVAPAPVPVAVTSEPRPVAPPEPAVEAPKPVEPQPEPVSKPKPVVKAAPKRVEPKPAPVQVAKAEPVPEQPAPQRREPVVHNSEPAAQPAPPAAPAPPPAPAILKPGRDVGQPAPRQPQTVTVPAGTMITVRLRDRLTASRSSVDDSFAATLDAPLVVDGFVLAERGTMQRGRVTESTAAGRVKGRAALALELTQLTTSDGQKVEIRTDAFRKEADSGVKSDAAKAGVMAGIGAAIGAIAGGGKGAAIGAATGGAAGTGAVLATRGKDVELPSETRLTFRLKESVTLTEKLN